MSNVGAEILPSAAFLRRLDHDLLTLRPVRMEDLDRCAAIEAACFPREQAASREAIRDRIAAYGEHFLIGELDGTVIGFVMGPVISQPAIADEMFGDSSCHNEKHPWQSVFSLSVHPDWQGRGYGRDLLNGLITQAKEEGRQGVTLTCLERKLAYYESFGFENRGVSRSVHGGAVWYDMILCF
ncbi:MAG: GNAT family N-acetyltransferase [Oscillospiraceae bacterium]|nr:GNAT family N-acetyltransferase [Oscillospiraceae bacterium]